MALLLVQEHEWLTHDDAKDVRVSELEEWLVRLAWIF